MTRATIALLTLATLGAAARADCMILKKGGKLQVWGMPATVGGAQNPIEITPENAELYADQSTGIIEAEGYDFITAKRGASAKAEPIPVSEVVAVYYSSEPDDLVTALAEKDSGAFLQAIGDFRAVLQDPEAREAFKQRAQFEIGICYYSAGRRADCIKHFQAWKAANSKYTPEVYRILAELLTEDRKFAEARAQYDEIPKLPGIPDSWKFRARLGAVRVDTAERKFDDAERTAQAIARETLNKADLADANVLAQVLQAEAIWRGGKADRLAEAATTLERAEAIEGVSASTRAFLLVTRGNILYAQGKPEDARFPYMRAALMYPDSGYDAMAYLNAGQCLLDMSGRETKDQAKSDELFKGGMKLLATAAGTYKDKDAQKRFRENKSRYDALLAQDSGATEGAGETEKPEGK